MGDRLSPVTLGLRLSGEAHGVADEFAARRLPLDVLHLDIDYMNGHRVFTWDPKRFPDPAGDVPTSTVAGCTPSRSSTPGVKPSPATPVFDAGLELDAFIRDADGRARHRIRLARASACSPTSSGRTSADGGATFTAVLVDAGVAGIWNDMNEPALYDGPVGADDRRTVVEMPADAVQGPQRTARSHGDVHNVYGTSMARAASEALARLRPERRSFALTRSGFAGVQRYAALWTGDNASSWEHLRMSLPMLCNLGLSGIPFVGADIGGFFGDASPELFARWMQVGVLYPMMRGHSHKVTRPNEPWAFGDEVEAVARQGAATSLPTAALSVHRCSMMRPRPEHRSCVRCCGRFRRPAGSGRRG